MVLSPYIKFCLPYTTVIYICIYLLISTIYISKEVTDDHFFYRRKKTFWSLLSIVKRGIGIPEEVVLHKENGNLKLKVVERLWSLPNSKESS